MGFSVSASAAVIFVGALVAFGTLYPAVANGGERIETARDAQSEDTLRLRNTAVNVTNVTYNATTDTLDVYVENTGATSLSVNHTDVLADNTYLYPWDRSEVDGDAGTAVWEPGATLHVTYSYDADTPAPTAVVVVTGQGVADREVV